MSGGPRRTQSLYDPRKGAVNLRADRRSLTGKNSIPIAGAVINVSLIVFFEVQSGAVIAPVRSPPRRRRDTDRAPPRRRQSREPAHAPPRAAASRGRPAARRENARGISVLPRPRGP